MSAPASQLLRLTMLLSPSFPVGGFAYSHGLEQAAADGQVRDSDTLRQWLASLIERGSQWNDAVLLAEAHRRAGHTEALGDLMDLAEALSGSMERHLEQQNLGQAFISAVRATGLPLPEALGEKAAYPVAVGAAAACQVLDLASTISVYVHCFASGQIQCAIRLGVLGQTGFFDLFSFVKFERLNGIIELGTFRQPD